MIKKNGALFSRMFKNSYEVKMKTIFDLTGIAVITGSSKGIGRAMAERWPVGATVFKSKPICVRGWLDKPELSNQAGGAVAIPANISAKKCRGAN